MCKAEAREGKLQRNKWQKCLVGERQRRKEPEEAAVGSGVMGQWTESSVWRINPTGTGWGKVPAPLTPSTLLPPCHCPQITPKLLLLLSSVTKKPQPRSMCTCRIPLLQQGWELCSPPSLCRRNHPTCQLQRLNNHVHFLLSHPPCPVLGAFKAPQLPSTPSFACTPSPWCFWGQLLIQH